MDDYRTEKVRRLMSSTKASPELKLAQTAISLCQSIKDGSLEPEEQEERKALVKSGILQVLKLVAPPGVGMLIEAVSKGPSLGVATATVVVGGLIALGLVATLAKILRDASKVKPEEADSKEEGHLPAEGKMSLKARLGHLFESDRTMEVEGWVPIKRESTEVDTGKAIDLTKVKPSVQSAISEAARISGIAPSVLYAIANIESRLGQSTVATTSSARGMFQIVRGTWNELVNRYGDKYNIKPDDYNDDRASAIMGALYLRDLAIEYKKRSGTAPTVTELYLMYLLGMRKGMLFFSKMQDDPGAPADEAFSREAKANFSVFYTKTSKGVAAPRSYLEVYRYLQGRVETVEVATDKALRASTETAPAVQVEAVPQAKPVVKGPALIPSTTVAPIPSVLRAPPAVVNVPVVPNTKQPQREAQASVSDQPSTQRKPQSALRLPTGLVVGVN